MHWCIKLTIHQALVFTSAVVICFPTLVDVILGMEEDEFSVARALQEHIDIVAAR